jgi:hypothetical protein
MNEYTGIIGIAETILGQECYSVHELIYESEYVSVEQVKSCYESSGIKWNSIIAGDVERVLRGNETQYFKDWTEWEKEYRKNHNVFKFSKHDPSGGFYLASIVKEMKTLIDYLDDPNGRSNYLYKTFLESGWACHEEQKYFYNSSEWQRLAKSIRMIDGRTCVSCKSRNVEMHVHHNSPIKSAYSRKFSDNFHDWGLSLMCKTCHERFHSTRYRSLSENSFEYMEPNEMKEIKILISSFWKHYHEEKRCEFCKVNL